MNTHSWPSGSKITGPGSTAMATNQSTAGDTEAATPFSSETRKGYWVANFCPYHHPSLPSIPHKWMIELQLDNASKMMCTACNKKKKYDIMKQSVQFENTDQIITAIKDIDPNADRKVLLKI